VALADLVTVGAARFRPRHSLYEQIDLLEGRQAASPARAPETCSRGSGGAEEEGESRDHLSPLLSGVAGEPRLAAAGTPVNQRR
jgi:hypothetical protein